jgi:uncharacterized protein (DUF1330 family)
MAAYVVLCITWHDTEALERYGKVVLDSFRKYNGKWLARGASVAALEGESEPKRLVIVEFPSVEAARKWHASSEYAPAVKIREQHATTHWAVLMDGIE